MSRSKKLYKGAREAFSIQKVSVGYDKFLEKVAKIEDETSLMWYPPYNIRKTSLSEYVVDVDLSGYNKEDIKASIDNNALVISAPASTAFEDPEGDDVYYHQGIYRGGEVKIKFFVASGLKLDSANYDDGIVSFKFVSTPEESKSYMVPIGPFEASVDAAPYVPVFDSSGRPVGKSEVDEVEKFELESREDVVVVVNEESHRKPTVEVVLPDPLPQVVEVKLDQVATEIDKKSEEPQATIVVTDATFEVVSDDVVTDVIKTEEGKADVVVAIPTEVKEAAHEIGLNIVDAIEKAAKKAEVTEPELPAVVESPVVEVTTTSDVVVEVPTVLPSVVEAKVEDGKVVLSDTSEHIPTTADLIPVVTKEGQPDVVIAVTPATESHLEELGVDVASDIGNAIVEAGANVATSVVVPEPPIETTETPVVLYGETDTKPTVEVVLPDPLPQIVEVTVEKVEENIDNSSEHPQVVLKVEEAIHEVSDNVELTVIKTEAGKSDIVMAMNKEDKEKLNDEVGINPVEAVIEAVVESELPAPELPVVEETPIVETPVALDTKTEVVVVAPEVIPQVVEAVVEVVPATFNSAGEPQDVEVKVKLEDVAENVPADATLVPVVTAKGEHDIVVAVTPEASAVMENMGTDVVSVVTEALVEAKTEVVHAEPTVEVSKPDVTVSEGSSSVILNADNPTVPTVEVVMPEVMPQVAEAVVTVDPVVDPVSEVPQVKIEVVDATTKVSEDVTVEVVKTEEGKADVVVALDNSKKSEAEAAGVNVAEAIKTAYNAVPEVVAPELPPVETVATVEVDITEKPVEANTIVVPEVVTPVVEAVVTEEGKVELVDASENVPADATLVPVETMEGQPNIVVAVAPETAEVLNAEPTVIAEVVSDVVKAEEVTVETSPSVKVEETPTVSIVLNTETTTIPTVEVIVPDPIPQVVEVKLDEMVAGEVDPTSKEPQVTLTVTDATYEVSDNVATTTVKTPEGSTDVVVAVTEELKTNLSTNGVEVLDTVTNAINSAVAELTVEVATPAEIENVEPVVVTVNDPTTDEPKLEVTVDSTIPQVVEASITESVTGAPAIVLTDVSENVPADATLVPVVTAEGQSDIMVAVTPEVKTELEAANVNIVEDISKALVEAQVEVKVTE